MEVRYANAQEIDSWNSRILANPDGGNLLQGEEFAEIKKLGKWQPVFVVAGDVSVLILKKRVFGLGNLWYIPRGPGVSSAQELVDILPGLQKLAEASGVFLIKFDPEIELSDSSLKILVDAGLLPARRVQPSSTVLIDLTPTEDEILAGLNQKGRHALRRAERDGAKVKKVEATEENCRVFYNLLAVTAEGSFGIRKFEYYKKFWQSYEAAGMGQMFFAYNGKDLIAAAFAVVFGEKSIYKDGASVRERPVYGASHLLQWHVIKWAKQQGSKVHDLYGAPPSDQVDNREHPFYGFGVFKRSFNKQVVDYVGTYDLPVKALPYKLWRKFGERVVRSLWYRIHHENYY